MVLTSTGGASTQDIQGVWKAEKHPYFMPSVGFKICILTCKIWFLLAVDGFWWGFQYSWSIAFKQAYRLYAGKQCVYRANDVMYFGPGLNDSLAFFFFICIYKMTHTENQKSWPLSRSHRM